MQPDPAWLEKLVEFTQWLARLSDGRFPVALSLMRDHLPARGLALQPIAETPQQMQVLLQCARILWAA